MVLKKRVTTTGHTSQIGVYIFKYTVGKAWDDGGVGIPGTIENAFLVSINGAACYPVVN